MEPVDLQRAVEDILVFMELCTPATKTARQIPLASFQAVEPLTTDFLSAVDYRPGEGIFPDATIKDLDRSLDVSLLGNVENDLPFPSTCAPFYVKRLRQVSTKGVRGKVKPYPFTIEQSFVMLDSKGTYEARRHYCGSFNQKDWYPSSLDVEPGASASQITKDVGLAAGFQFNHRYDWRVLLGYEGSASVAFSTDPIGVREVFRLRDIPEGRSRRAALRHWVENHWRKKRKDDDNATIQVRSHLRGADKFSWHGLSCSVRPSGFDLDRARQCK